LVIGETLDNQMKTYIRSVRDLGYLITSLIAVGKAVVRKVDASLLTENEGLFVIFNVQLGKISSILLKERVAPRRSQQYMTLKQ